MPAFTWLIAEIVERFERKKNQRGMYFSEFSVLEERARMVEDCHRIIDVVLSV